MEGNIPACAFDTRFTHRPQRPPLHYRGGRFQNAERIIRHFPRHRIYVEPFGGGVSTIRKKPRSLIEVYNDLDQDILNLFQVMREPGSAARLVERVRWTPYARDELYAARQDADDPVEQARRTLIRTLMKYPSPAAPREDSTNFTARSRPHWSARGQEWRNLPEVLLTVAERLRGVIIENRDPFRVIAEYDSPDTLFYIDLFDVPRVPFPRRRHSYRDDVAEAQALALASTVCQVQGSVVISDCNSERYRDLLADWTRIEWRERDRRGRAGSEVLWLSPNIPEAERDASAACEVPS